MSPATITFCGFKRGREDIETPIVLMGYALVGLLIGVYLGQKPSLFLGIILLLAVEFQRVPKTWIFLIFERISFALLDSALG